MHAIRILCISFFFSIFPWLYMKISKVKVQIQLFEFDLIEFGLKFHFKNKEKNQTMGLTSYRKPTFKINAIQRRIVCTYIIMKLFIKITPVVSLDVDILNWTKRSATNRCIWKFQNIPRWIVEKMLSAFPCFVKKKNTLKILSFVWAEEKFGEFRGRARKREKKRCRKREKPELKHAIDGNDVWIEWKKCILS